MKCRDSSLGTAPPPGSPLAQERLSWDKPMVSGFLSTVLCPSQSLLSRRQKALETILLGAVRSMDRPFAQTDQALLEKCFRW